MKIRPKRIVTGVDSNNKSIIIADDTLEPSIDLEGSAFTELWETDNKDLDRTSSKARHREGIKLSPPTGGTKFRYFQLPPKNDNYSPEEMEAFFAAAFEMIGASHERTDTAKHPGMHLTKTVDYIVLLEGKATLILDSDEVVLNPYDVVIQQGTSHAWSVESDIPCLFLAVLIDKEFSS
jgi:hypothetical protein